MKPKACNLFAAAVCLLLLSPQVAVAQGSAAADTLTRPERLPPSRLAERQTWERVVDAPGEIVYAPFGLLFYGVESFLAYQERTRFLQRLRDRFIWDDGTKALIPAVESRTGVGLAYADRQWTGPLPRLQIGVMGGFRRRHGMLVAASNDRVRLGLDVRRRPDEAFWGIGPATSKTDQSRYERTVATQSVEVALHDGGTLRTVAHVGLEWNAMRDADSDEYPDLTDRFGALPGSTGEAVFANAGLTVLGDTRDQPGNPRAGWLAMGRAQVTRELSHGDFDFVRFNAEAVRYLHIYSGRVLLARIGGSAVAPLSGGRVPFYHLSEVGDEATTIRGFDRGRYRDRQAVFGGVEYRWPVWHVIDGLAFVNAGQVGRSMTDDIDADLVRVSWGAGLRLWRDTGVASRLLVTRSDDGTRLQAFLASSF